ncbi:PREDICTED: uncharacterized protein LOC104622748, partial [Phaethon lepturus]|uniref:uncharacterized protein LOC104622748 n=1 Tax=Phaethon lepturus TaxID=97097 RepID=UPI0005306453
MSDKSDLKAELERKKQRLAQIREEKKRKEEERKKKEADLQQKKEPAQEDSDLDRKRRETEALLQSIGISPEPPLVPTPMSPSSKSVSTPSDAGSQDSGDLGPIGRRFKRPQSCYAMIPRNIESVTGLVSVLTLLESFDQVFERRMYRIHSERDKVGPRHEWRKKFRSREEAGLGGKGRDARVAASVCVLLEKRLACIQDSRGVWCNCEVDSQLLCNLSSNLIVRVILKLLLTNKDHLSM